ncbi:unnamed protein product [Effrenium voratum]|uniref:JmjC domain-containing protein n=1 Tax=Effrenium voratum TaxID=2562239 RepID=A0AA36JIC2_9DINO|nr:unnamed protein product [Effrenium voratum]
MAAKHRSTACLSIQVACAAAALACMGIPDLRWKAVLFVYLPFRDAEFVQPWLDSYLDLEMWWNPENFKEGEVAEMHVADYSWEKMERLSEGFRKPIVVRGLLNDTRGSQNFLTPQWVESHGDFDMIEAVPRDDFKFAYTYRDVKFSEYVEAIRQGIYRYTNGLDEMVTRYPDIAEDMGLERIGVPQGCRALALFINGGGKGLQWHNANNVNLVGMYRGTKIWDVLDGKYSVFLGVEMVVDPFSTGFNSLKGKSTWDRLPVREVALNPGDVYVNPSWYWHKVRNIPDPETGLVFMNSCRWSDVTASLRAQPALELFRHFGQYTWVHPSLPTVLRWVPFARVVQDGIREAMGWMPRYGEPGYEDDCYSSKVSACERKFAKLGLPTRAER